MSPLWRGAILPILLTGALLPAPRPGHDRARGYAVHGIDISGHNHPGSSRSTGGRWRRAGRSSSPSRPPRAIGASG
ncbi:hypothetical protein ACFQ0B_36770 [Nonomuraea thailandensis]